MAARGAGAAGAAWSTERDIPDNLLGLGKLTAIGAAFSLATVLFWATMLSSPPSTEAAAHVTSTDLDDLRRCGRLHCLVRMSMTFNPSPRRGKPLSHSW